MSIRRPLPVLLASVALLSCTGDSPTGPGGGGGGGGGGRPVRIELSSRTLNLRDGDSIRLSVTAFNRRNQPLPSLPPELVLAWSSSDTTRADVHSGLVRGVHPGAAWIRVTTGTLADSARVEVAAVQRALQLVRGSGQSGVVGLPLRDSITVRAVDRHGNGVAGVPVAFSTASGEGGATPASTQTDSTGHARTTWVLGQRSGAQRLEARSGELPPVVVSSAALPGPAARMEEEGGNGQTGGAGEALPTPLAVRVRDGFDNPVPGATVTWAVSAGEGRLDPLISTSDSAGVATTRWTLGRGAGPNSATAAGAGATVAFRATARAGAPSQLAKVSGDGQEATVGRKVAADLVVRVADAHGNPIAGLPVAWAVLGGGGTLSQASGTSDSLGLARASWSLGTAAGGQLASATAVGSQPAVFTATARADVPATFRAKGGNEQQAAAGTAATEPLSVEARDRFDNPVRGLNVSWAVVSGGGSVDAPVSPTNAQGVSAARWTLGTRAGVNVASAAVPGFPPVVFSATGAAGPAASVAVHGGSGQIARVGESLAEPLAVRVADRFGNPVQQAQVTWSSGQSVSFGSGTTRSGADGVAGTGVNVGPAPGYKNVTAAVAGLAPAAFRVFALGFTAAEIASGGGMACALTAQGKAYCWGGVHLGGVGDGGTGERTRATAVSGGLTFADITVGTTSACGVATDAKIYCWGQNSFGVLGNGTTVGSQLTPQPVSSALSFTRVAGNTQSVCALDTGGAAHCWGRQAGPTETTTTTWTVPTAVAGGHRFTRITAGNETACGLTADGTAYCWGRNYRGSLGDGTTTPRPDPVAVAGGLRFREISTSGTVTCGIATDGATYCWGYNLIGQVGDGSSTDRSVPTRVVTGESFVAVSAGSNQVCARTAGGKAYCWGVDSSGSMGVGGGGTFRTPTPVSGGLQFSRIEAGYNAACGVAEYGQVFCWGSNYYGQVGDGTTTPRYLPTGTLQ